MSILLSNQNVKSIMHCHENFREKNREKIDTRRHREEKLSRIIHQRDVKRLKMQSVEHIVFVKVSSHLYQNDSVEVLPQQLKSEMLI